MADDAQIIAPHGGKLVDRVISEPEKKKWEQKAEKLPEIKLDNRQESDLEMIAIGGFSPLEGFMNSSDHEKVVSEMHLEDGTAWSIPITLSVDSRQAERLEVGEPVLLMNQQEEELAVLHLQEKYKIDKERRAEAVFGTADPEHPGVQKTLEMGDICLAGPVDVLKHSFHRRFQEYRLEPAQTRDYFQEQGWNDVVGFQTRNPVHRAHEYLLKCALEIVDGLLLHPLVGDTKEGDVPAEVRMECYETVLEKYFPDDRVKLSVMPAKMNYAGPREAILHAIIRKNYGCSHFIVGRDHAGVGDYYGTYAAQEVFSQFTEEELGIKPLFFEYAFWCEVCGNIASSKTCPHGAEDQIYLSGTKVREMLRNGEDLPEEFSRPEVAEVLRKAYA